MLTAFLSVWGKHVLNCGKQFPHVLYSTRKLKKIYNWNLHNRKYFFSLKMENSSCFPFRKTNSFFHTNKKLPFFVFFQSDLQLDIIFTLLHADLAKYFPYDSFSGTFIDIQSLVITFYKPFPRMNQKQHIQIKLPMLEQLFQ